MLPKISRLEECCFSSNTFKAKHSATPIAWLYFYTLVWNNIDCYVKSRKYNSSHRTQWRLTLGIWYMYNLFLNLLNYLHKWNGSNKRNCGSHFTEWSITKVVRSCQQGYTSSCSWLGSHTAGYSVIHILGQYPKYPSGYSVVIWPTLFSLQIPSWTPKNLFLVKLICKLMWKVLVL